MINYKWTYCLNEEQFSKLYHIIKTVPSFSSYLNETDSSNLLDIIESFRNESEPEGLLTTGMSITLDVISKRYDLMKKEYEESHTIGSSIYKYQVDSILNWNPKPMWTKGMTLEEIDYIDLFIPQVDGLLQYLYQSSNIENLYDLIVYFQMKINATGRNNPDLDFLLETIKERFYRISDDHEDAIHYVNHSQEIDDKSLISSFDKEANKDFYRVNIEKNICGDLLNKYIHLHNPYIAGEVFLRLFRANKIDIALSFAQRAFSYIFSSPNIYWHNKEAMFGSVNILNTLLEALGFNGFQMLTNEFPKIAISLVNSLYLVLSRSIYWTDKETVNYQVYEDNKMPIHIQHKLRAFRLRSYFIELFGYKLLPDVEKTDYCMMALADMYSAHDIAYTNKIVGHNSVFKLDAIRIFHTKGLYKICSPKQASERGFVLNDNLAKEIHRKYKTGLLCLSEKEISQLIAFCRLFFRQKKNESDNRLIPNLYMQKNNYYPIYKENASQVKEYLKQNGIRYFYHFTELDKMDSIIKYGGLLSYKRCLDEGIVLPLREDMALSRDIDAKLGLEDYARLSFNAHLPKIDERIKEGAKLVMLKVSTEVALFEDTIFTNIEATHSGLSFGTSFNDLCRVNFTATKRINVPPEDYEYLHSQAEVLVKGFIPLKYIINIDNPVFLN